MGKVNTQEALKLRTENKLTYAEIAKLQGVTKPAVYQALQRLIPEKEDIEIYEKNKADILSNLEFTMLESYSALTPEEQKELVKRRGMVDFGIIYDKNRLQRGLSSQNVDLHVLNADLKGLDRQEQELLKIIEGRKITTDEVTLEG